MRRWRIIGDFLLFVHMINIIAAVAEYLQDIASTEIDVQSKAGGGENEAQKELHSYKDIKMFIRREMVWKVLYIIILIMVRF